MDCIKCDHWNQTKNFCGDEIKWVDPETGDRVCRFREGAVCKYSSDHFDAIKPKLRKVQKSLNWLELECELPVKCIDRVTDIINDISIVIADISDHESEVKLEA